MKAPKKITKTNKYATETMVLITNVISSYYKLPNTIFKSKSRKRNVIVAKQFIIYFIKKFLPDITMQEIAKFTCYANHCNVLYSLKTVENNIQFDNKFKSDFTELDKLLQVSNVSITLGKDVEEICYYIDLNNIYSAKTSDGKAIIFSGFSKAEIYESLSLIPIMVTTKKVRKHDNTKLYLLENNVEESD